jgi:Sodium:alanine symporter family
LDEFWIMVFPPEPPHREERSCEGVLGSPQRKARQGLQPFNEAPYPFVLESIAIGPYIKLCIRRGQRRIHNTAQGRAERVPADRARLVMFGSIGTLRLVWAMADLSMGLMALINLIAILALGKYVLAAWRDYVAQRDAGISSPVFTRRTIPVLDAILPLDVWGSNGPLARPRRPRQRVAMGCAAPPNATGSTAGSTLRESD